MSTLLIVGAGGHGRVIADAALAGGVWDSVCFVDDRGEEITETGVSVVGECADLDRLVHKYTHVVVGIGDAATRLELIDRCQRLGFQLPVIAHPSAAVSAQASVGPGCVIFAQAAVNPGAVLGVGCIVNTGATVDHDCVLADGVHICPGAHLAGNVQVASRAWIGIGASVKQGISIGTGAVVGAGAAVVSDVAPGLTVTGVPARVRT